MFIIEGKNTSTEILIFEKMERKNKNFIGPLWYVNREEKPEYP